MGIRSAAALIALLYRGAIGLTEAGRNVLKRYGAGDSRSSI
jgi:hypothetical protein